MKLDTRSYKINEILEEAISPLRPVAEQRGINLINQNADSDHLIICDRTRLVIALSNLIDNAIKFSGANMEVLMGWEILNNETQIFVQDYGIGIDDEDLPFIFDRFFRGRSDSPQKGRGLGLSIAQSIIEAHDGTISVDIEYVEGAKFILSIPHTRTIPS